MRKNNSQNPRKSSNRGHQSKKNSTEFNQEQENYIFSHILGMLEYNNMGISSGFYEGGGYYDKLSPFRKKSTKDYQHLDDYIKSHYDEIDNDLPF